MAGVAPVGDEIDDQGADNEDRRGEDGRSDHKRKIPIQRGGYCHASDAVEPEYRLRDDRTAHDDGELKATQGDDWIQRRRQHVRQIDLALAKPLGFRFVLIAFVRFFTADGSCNCCGT